MAINLLNIKPHKVSKDLSGYITYIYGAWVFGAPYIEIYRKKLL